MAEYRTVLTDVDRQVWLESAELRPSDEVTLAGAAGWSIQRRTLRGGLSDGVDVVSMDNGALCVDILPTRGMGLWRGSFRGTPVGWDSPVQRPVHPAFVNLHDRGGLGWLHGFNELLCRCGLAFNGPPGDDVDGTAVTLHGKIANTPAHFVEAVIATGGPGALSVRGCVEEASMFGGRLRLTTTYSTEAGSNTLTIRDEVENLSAQPAELELLYHLNLGRPFLEAGARLVAPVRSVAPRDARAAEGIDDWPTCAGPVAGYAEQVYFLDLLPGAEGRTPVLLTNADRTRGVGLQLNPEQLPCFSFWKNTQAEADGYVAGLEPATNYPNFKAFEREQGRVISLTPGARWEAAWSVSVFDDPEALAAVEAQIATIQQGTAPVAHRQPHAGFSPV